jgi:hypothetical protein
MNIRSVMIRLALSGVLAYQPFIALAEQMAQQPEPEVTFISGGIGESELEMMQGRAKDFSLEFVFVQKLKQKEEFLANVNLKIQDAHQNIVVDTVTDGPYLFVNLPKGKYAVTAEYGGEIKRQKVYVSTKKHQKVVFWWPNLEHTEADTEQAE